MFGDFVMPATSSSSNKFKCVADALGLGTLRDGDEGFNSDILLDLYAHARNEDGQRVLLQDKTFSKAWINLDSARAKELIAALVPLDEDDLKHARRQAQTNLEAVAWNDLLGIETPPIQCHVKIHGNKWALRFQSTGALKGQEQRNEDLPAAQVRRSNTPVSLPSAALPSVSALPPPLTPMATLNPPPSPPSAMEAAADALRKAGLPI
jgi:hypothetical protein